MNTLTNEFDHPADFARGGDHAPIVLRNTAPEGIASMLGCTCGYRPKTQPQSVRSMDTAYRNPRADAFWLQDEELLSRRLPGWHLRRWDGRGTSGTTP